MISDTLVIVKRNLLRVLHTPQLLFFSIVQPVMFVLLFRYVFGGSIKLPGVNYVDYLLPGIMVQTTMFAGGQTAIGLAEDAKSGILDRFRSLPMARSAVLAGRTLSDSVRGLFVSILMIAVGFLVGFRFHNGIIPGISAVLVAVLFGFSVAWFFAFMGLSLRDPETAQVASFLPIFPFVFASSVFVRTDTLPSWLAAFARNQPITKIANAVRVLMQGHTRMARLGITESAGTLFLQSLAWMVAMVAIFAPPAVRKYRRG